MSVLDPRELEASPLSDLHALAAELGMEGYRRLRKEDLIRQIVEAQGGTMPEAEPDAGDGDFEAIHESDTAEAPEPEEEKKPRRRGRRSKRTEEEPAVAVDDDIDKEPDFETAPEADAAPEDDGPEADVEPEV